MDRIRSRAAAATAVFLLLAAAGWTAHPKDTIEITDAAGRTVRLSRLPRRILAIGVGPQIVAHLIYMFPESRERFIGWERRGSTASEFIPWIDPDFDKKVFPGPNTGVEEIAALHADLILIRGTRPDPKGERLAALGIPVVYLGLEDPEQYREDVVRLGMLLGDSSRAEFINRYYGDRLRRIENRLAGLSDKDKPSVLLAMTMPRGGKIAVEVPALSWMQTIQVQRAGGRPVWAETAAATTGWTIVNMEQIARWDAARIILIIWHSLDPRETIEELAADPRWRELGAVKRKELRAFPADIYGWDSPDPRWILGVSWLARTFYPIRFADLDMKTEVMSFFGELYGMSEEDIAEKILPAIRMEYR